METWQKEHIRKHLPELLRNTVCTAIFLANLHADGIIAHEETDILGGIKTRIEQAQKFYEIVQTRRASYNFLKQALKDTAQTGALAILASCNDLSNTTPFKNYGTITYYKDKLLGRGCYNTRVFVGRFENRDVAVKLISTMDIDPEDALKEVHVLEKLDWHVNVIRYHKTEITDDFILIALELCDTNLFDWVTKSRAVEIEVVDIIKQATKGVAYLHGNGLVHRDLKPANILLVRHAIGKVRVKISDFGMSKRIPDGISKLSRHTSGIGTEGWMAPEVAGLMLHTNPPNLAPITVGYESDVFSLGCIYYFLLTNGTHPFGDPLRCQAYILDGRYDLTDEKITEIEAGASEYILLIEEMISHEYPKRPSVSAVLSRLTQLNSTEISGKPSKFEENIPHVPLIESKETTRPEHDVTDEGKHDNTELQDVDKPQKEKLDMELIQKGEKFLTSKNESVQSSLRDLLKTGNFEKAILLVRAIPNICNYIGLSTLELALQHDNCSPEILSQLVSLGANFKKTNRSQQNLLHIATRYDKIKLELLRYLLQLGLDINAIDDKGNTPLHFSLTQGMTFDKAYLLIENGGNVTLCDGNGDTSLGLAIANVNCTPEILSKLINQGADCQIMNKLHQNLLHIAAISKHYKMKLIRYLLELGLNANAVDKNGNTPIHYALPHFPFDIVWLLVEKGANVKSCDGNENTSLGLAILNSDCTVATLSKLIDLGADWRKTNKHKRNLIHIAANNNSPKLELLKYLIDLGLDINAIDVNSSTPLSLSVGSFDTTFFLIENGANVRLRYRVGYTLLGWAVTKENCTVDILSKLIKLGAEWKQTNNNQENLLHIAARCTKLSNFELLKYIIDLGVDVNAFCKEGYTPLHFPLRYNFEHAFLLIANGANVKLCDGEGDTSLGLAVQNVCGCTPEILSKLIALGADCKKINKRKQNLLHLATHSSPVHLELLEYLLGLGLNIDAVDLSGFTPLHYSLYRGFFDMALLLIEKGADVKKICGSYASTTLGLAIQGKDCPVEILSKLINLGVDCKIKNNYQQNLLHIAMYQNVKLEVLTYLLGLGLDIDAIDYHGFAPLHHSLVFGFFDSALVLIEKGANITLCTKNGQTPLELAVEYKRKQGDKLHNDTFQMEAFGQVLLCLTDY